MDITIQPIKNLQGLVSVPGDKSISHRALMLGGIAEGTTQISNLSFGEDVLSTWSCLEQLGVHIERSDNTVFVHGMGQTGLKKPKKQLYTGNSGTTIRLLSGLLAALSFDTTITGDRSLKKRPMNRIVLPLSKMGADISTEEGYPPLSFKGTTLLPIHYHSPVASAQVKSCILLAGLYTKGETSVTEPVKSRDHTERMLGCFSVNHFIKSDLEVAVHGPARLRATTIYVPGDISSAAFFIGAGMLVQDAKITIFDVGVNPTRIGIIHVLQQMGGNIKSVHMREENNEPRADLVVQSSSLKSTLISGDLIPQLIDEIPLLAVIATQAEGETVIRDAQELRVKETDRIESVAVNLRKMGVNLETREDGFIISGPQQLRGAVLDSFGDHRIAMAFAIAGLIAKGESVIKNAESAEISFPNFFKLLKTISHA